MSEPRISIVLPTRNGRATLPALLDAIESQRIDSPFEVVAIDSGSTDGSIEILRPRVQTLHQSYIEAKTGEIFAIAGSSGFVEISMKRASAAQEAGVGAGAAVGLVDPDAVE